MADSPIRVLRMPPGSTPGALSPVDPGRVLRGLPEQATDNRFSNAKGNFHCGVWSSTAGQWRVAYTEDEFCVLLEGTAILRDATGHAETFGPGEAFVIPAGFEGSWESVGSVRKFYAVYEDA